MEIEWWKRACEDNPHPIAFVDCDDRFIFVNRAWSELTGWSASQLVSVKRWQEITTPEDVGGGQAETEHVKHGDCESYYQTKEYLTPTGGKVAVGIYVHRHPPFGPQQGYIVFAIRLNSREHETLRNAFGELQSRVTILQEQQLGFHAVMERLDRLEQQQRATNERVDRVMLEAKAGVSITGGIAGADQVGRDKTSNDTRVVLYVAAALVAVALVSLGGKLYLDNQHLQLRLESSSQEARP